MLTLFAQLEINDKFIACLGDSPEVPIFLRCELVLLCSSQLVLLCSFECLQVQRASGKHEDEETRC